MTYHESRIEISLCDKATDPEEGTKAQAAEDRILPISIISRTMIQRLKLESALTEAAQGPVYDSSGKSYTPIGKVDLWWRKNSFKTNRETFLVVDQSTPDVILRAFANIPPPTASRDFTEDLRKTLPASQPLAPTPARPIIHSAQAASNISSVAVEGDIGQYQNTTRKRPWSKLLWFERKVT